MTPRWLYALAVLTLLATLPLLTLGAEVTSKGEPWAMIDNVGMREPWHMLTVPLRDMGLGWIVEHSHRTAGYLVGFCSIALCAGLWFGERRRWVCWLGTAALAGVSIQGILGATRVSERSATLALVHGLFAPLVVAMLASIAWLTSRAGQVGGSVSSAKLRIGTLIALGVIYLQLILGALVRRYDYLLSARAHLLFAFVVVGVLVWMAKVAAESRDRGKPSFWSVHLVLLLLCGQLWLGVEAWLSKFFNPGSQWTQLVPLPMLLVELRSLHYVLGTLLFATCAVLALQVHLRRRVKPLAIPSTAIMEGAA